MIVNKHFFLKSIFAGDIFETLRFCDTYKALNLLCFGRGIVRYPLRPKLHAPCQH